MPKLIPFEKTTETTETETLSYIIFLYTALNQQDRTQSTPSKALQLQL